MQAIVTKNPEWGKADGETRLKKITSLGISLDSDALLKKEKSLLIII